MNGPTDPRDALVDVAVDRALWGEATGGVDRELERTAALITGALLRDGSLEAPPPALMERLQADGARWAQSLHTAVPAPQRRRRDQRPARTTVLPWLLAAAALVVATIAMWSRDGGGTQQRRQQLQQLIARPDTVVLELQPGPSDLRGTVHGSVVWNDAEQRGFLRLQGLPANDPNRQRYQLWIVDASRNETEPVDGGLFDVDGDTEESVVAVEERLPVGRATAFVVTVEKPSGIVVSKQEHVVCLAKR